MKEEASYEPGSLAHDAATSYGGALAMAVRAWPQARRRAAVVVASEAMKQAPYHGQISGMILCLTELRERSQSESMSVDEVQALLDGARITHEGHRIQMNMRVGAPLFISFRADAALTVAQNLSGTEGGAVAARHARALVDEMLVLIAEGNVLDRYVASEAYRLNSELRELEGRADESLIRAAG